MKCTCTDFEKAQETGTDNEMYGQLIHRYDDEYQIGSDLPPIKFCPWCGGEVPEV